VGFLYIKEHRYLVSLFMFIAVFLFLVTPAAMLTPLQVARTFEATCGGYGNREAFSAG
jgi:DHA3 family macrolide efflux protein-like MFS transporter